MSERNETEMAETLGQFSQLFWKGMYGEESVVAAKSPDEAYQRSLQLSDEMMGCMLELQAEWIRLCVAGLEAGGAEASGARQLAGQMKSTAGQLSEFQQQAWQAWLSAARQVEPYKGMGEVQTPPLAVTGVWRDFFEKTAEMQRDWLRMMSPPVGDQARGKKPVTRRSTPTAA